MQKRKRPTFIENAIKIAFQIADRSEDPYKQVGCVCIDKHGTYISNGYNGAPADVEIDWEDRDGRRKYVVHAEENALMRAGMYNTDILVCTMLPCPHCLLICRQYKVRKVIYVDLYSHESYGSVQDTEKMAKTLGIELEKWNKPEEEAV